MVRGERVILDRDLAELYDVPTKALNQAVSRNRERFPEDFMFRLSKEELEFWRSHIVTSNPKARMALRRPPRAFTEQGVAMLSAVLRSARAVRASVAIVRTFVRLRRILAEDRELAQRVAEHDQQIDQLFEAVRALIEPGEVGGKRRIGFEEA